MRCLCYSLELIAYAWHMLLSRLANNFVCMCYICALIFRGKESIWCVSIHILWWREYVLVMHYIFSQHSPSFWTIGGRIYDGYATLIYQQWVLHREIEDWSVNDSRFIQRLYQLSLWLELCLTYSSNCIQRYHGLRGWSTLLLPMSWREIPSRQLDHPRWTSCWINLSAP